jgi:Ankyrin repeats (3 copies)
MVPWGVGRRVRRAMEDGDWTLMVELANKHGAAATTVSGENGLTPLHHACYKGKMLVATTLLDRGADVAARSKLGATPLHAAARADRALVCDLLVARGAAPDAADNLGATALHEAAWRGHRTVVKTLLALGASPHVKNVGGHKPVDLVRGRGLKELRHVLLSAMGTAAGGASSDDGGSATTASSTFDGKDGGSDTTSVDAERHGLVPAGTTSVRFNVS